VDTPIRLFIIESESAIAETPQLFICSKAAIAPGKIASVHFSPTSNLRAPGIYLSE
jgi:hypothetical protein